jgi:hypothetical protein
VGQLGRQSIDGDVTSIVVVTDCLDQQGKGVNTFYS